MESNLADRMKGDIPTFFLLSEKKKKNVKIF
jgi:hypothetical protein